MHYGINTMFYYEDLIHCGKGKKNSIPLDELNKVACPQIDTDEIFIYHDQLEIFIYHDQLEIFIYHDQLEIFFYYDQSEIFIYHDQLES